VRKSTVVMIAFAVVFGLLAVFVAQSWLNSQAELRMRSLEANKKPVSTRTIVVAAKPLRFGQELAAAQLREMEWPAEALPTGAVAKISELLGEGRRVALTAIEPNEPVLGTKITGPGQRATLSAMLRDGLKAVTPPAPKWFFRMRACSRSIRSRMSAPTSPRWSRRSRWRSISSARRSCSFRLRSGRCR
jgi:pilus assembly protein CpaB